MEEKLLNIEELMYVFKKKIWIVIVCVLVFTAFGVYKSSKMQPSYEGRVKIFAGNNAEIQGSYSTGELNNYKQLISSYIEIIKTEDFMNKVIKKGNLDITPGQMLGGLSFNTAEAAPILTISYRAADPKIAEKVVNTLSTEFEAGVQEIILNTYTKVIDSTRVLTYYPNKRRTIMLGFMSGLILAIGLVLVLDYLDDTLVRKKDLEKLIPIPVLGEIAIEEDSSKHSKKRRRNSKKNKGDA